MRVTNVRKDKKGCQIDSKDWYYFTPELFNWVVNHQIYGCIVTLEFVEDAKKEQRISKMTILDNPKEQTPPETSDNIKLRSMALSYAKDMVINEILKKEDIFAIADQLLRYIETGKHPNVE